MEAALSCSAGVLGGSSTCYNTIYPNSNSNKKKTRDCSYHFRHAKLSVGYIPLISLHWLISLKPSTVVPNGICHKI